LNLELEISSSIYIRSSPAPPPKKKVAPLPPTPCPKCGHIVIVEKKRKLPCPGCGCSLFVEYNGENRELVMLDDEGLERFRKRGEELRIIGNGIKWFGRRGMTKQAIEDERIRLEKIGHPCRYWDAVWTLAGEIASRELRRGDHQELRSLYYSMALFLSLDGKDPSILLRESHRHELLYIGRPDILVEISGPANTWDCQACKKLHGKRMTVAEALRTQPLPNPRCTHRMDDGGYPFCRCCYARVYDWNHDS
jgi:hypothetical protein